MTRIFPMDIYVLNLRYFLFVSFEIQRVISQKILRRNE